MKSLIPAVLWEDTSLGGAFRSGRPDLCLVYLGSCQVGLSRDRPWEPAWLMVPLTNLLLQVMGLGLSSIFALCLGHTTSFLKAVIFASASVGLQTFNHR